MFEDYAPETLLDPGAIPKVTAVLGGEGLVEEIRGVAGSTIRPVSAAVVIGLGGSGVQTVARLKSAVRAGRIDQEAHDSVSFLAIDAVGTERMQPPLPPGVAIGADLVNLSGFNAGAYLAGQLPNDAFLRTWWDGDYKVPTGELVDGLKRERMLGRLCFHQEVPRIRAAIHAKVAEAMRLTPENLAGGHGGVAGGEIAVYLVCSSVGGTGSSAFLEVLGAVHLVAQELGVTPKIRAFILLPGAFRTSFDDQQSALTIAAAQRANAYGFFKELDHFIAKEGELLEYLGHQGHKVANGNLIHSVYLFDANVGSRGMLHSVTDLYEIIAESIYQFLFSTVGRAILGSDGVNIERILLEADRFRKPRRYCSLGLSRIVFPGDSFRFHLVMWWCDWFLRNGFLKEPTAEEIVELKDSDQVAGLLETLTSFVQQAGEGQFDDLVKAFIDVGRDAPSALEANPDPTNAQDTISTLEDQLPAVTMEIRQVLEGLRPRLLDRLTEVVEAGVFSTTASVPRAREIVKVLLKRSRTQLADAESALSGQIAARSAAVDLMEDRLEDLIEAAGRNILEAAIARVVALVNDDVAPSSEAAERTGQAVKDWTRAVVASEYAQARRDYLVVACRRLGELLAELERAQRLMQEMADEARDLWERDELIGKDAGPDATSVLIPKDTMPDIELSELSRSVRIAIGDEHGAKLSDEALSEFHTKLIAGSLTRGFFDVGNRDPLRRKRARDALLGQLEQDAYDHALHTADEAGERRPRLPLHLVEAATRLDEQARLGTAMAGLRQISQEVCWSWEPGRFQLGGDEAARAKDRPRVTTAVIAHESMEELVRAEFADPDARAQAPDPERVLALSCEWAVPIHCLPAVDSWREDYRRLAAKREAERLDPPSQGVEPPNHIDRRFEQFPDLIPEYFQPEQAAPWFVKGLLIAAALSSENTAATVVDLYERDATRPPVSPIRQAPGIGFVARRVSNREGSLVPTAGDDTELGTSWHGALRGVGLDLGLQRSLDECWAVVVREVEPQLLIDLLHEVVAPKIERAKRKRKLPAADAQALGHLFNALTDLLDELAEYT